MEILAESSDGDSGTRDPEDTRNSVPERRSRVLPGRTDNSPDGTLTRKDQAVVTAYGQVYV